MCEDTVCFKKTAAVQRILLTSLIPKNNMLTKGLQKYSVESQNLTIKKGNSVKQGKR